MSLWYDKLHRRFVVKENVGVTEKAERSEVIDIAQNGILLRGL